MTSNSKLLDFALRYAAQGWPVLPLHTPVNGACSCGRPCESPGKHPRNEHGLSEATTNPEIIIGWWTTWPDANIGIRTGMLSGIVVVDTDLKHGGPSNWSDLQDIHGPIKTLTALTGGGGNHWIFQAPTDHKLRSTSGALGQGIDTKGEGGYIVVAPSLHISGNWYEWEDRTSIGPVPTWVLDMWPLVAGAVGSTNHRPAPPIGESVPEGERNDTMTSLVGSMWERGMSLEAITAAAHTENESKFRPPLPSDEVDAVITSITSRYPQGARLPEHRPSASTPPTHGAQPPPSDESEWGPLGDLPSGTPAVPTLPAEMVPEPFRDWTTDIASRACMPLESVVCPALTAAGAVVGRGIGIKPGRYDDYLVVPNLWGALIARPGAMKTNAINEGTRPITRLEAIAHDRFQADAGQNDAMKERIIAEINAIKTDMGKAARGSSTSEIADFETALVAKNTELREAEVTETRYVTQDPTVEKLGELLNQNPRGLLVLRDELTGWLRSMDKPGHETDRAFYLESWNGTGGYTVDRIGRGTVRIKALTISLFGGIQPGKLQSYIQGAIDGNEGADGLLQRLQVSVWPDSLGEWTNPETWPDTEAKNRAFEIFTYLDQLDSTSIGAKHEDEDSISYLRFSPEGQAIFDTWRDALEHRLRSDELKPYPAFESHLSKYRSLMPSLALLFHLINIANGSPAGSIPEEHTRMAAAWCEFLEAHARKIYSLELFPGHEAAITLATKIQQGAVTDGQTVRDIYNNHHWGGLRTVTEVNSALNVLTECNWVRVEPITETGGRSSPVVRLHPGIRVAANE